MRKGIMLIAAAGLGLALVGCTQTAGTGDTQPGSAPSTAPAAAVPAAPAAPSAQAVWAGTLATKTYRSWQAAPGFETKQPARGPHGKSVQTFVDPNVVKTLSGPAATAWPTGSMIVKDAFDAAGALQGIEYMQKTDQGWYFASFGADGSVSKEGVQAEPCQACHTKGGSDAVKSFKLP